MSSVEFAAGWISGAAGLVLGHPIDTVKVRLQTQSGYRNVSDCVVKTYRRETLRGFFKGMSFPLLTVASVNSVTFGVYSNALLFWSDAPRRERRRKTPGYGHIFAAGGVSGAAQALVLAPVDLVKVRLQNQTHPYGGPAAASSASQPRYRGPVHCGASILREEGVAGLFRGTAALMLRDVPTMAVYFATYAGICRRMTPEKAEPDPGTVLLAGGLAGTASWALATPMDVVKARLQMAEYRGVLHCVLASLRREGPRVFLKGLGLNAFRAFPVNAVTFLAYEEILKVLR